jgi:hypothetical protein
MKTAQLATLLFICLLGIMPVAASAQPFVISGDGTEVTDQKTGLIWRRCAEGMVFGGGTCTGTPSAFTHEAALQRAATRASSTGIAWRLPNVKELSSIADKSRSNPAIDTTAFPATPASWFWSASPDVGYSYNAWYVYFGNGYVGYDDGYRLNSYYVRLVRAGQ